MPLTAAGELIAATITLVGSAQPRCGTTMVVAIDGPSGAGKTDFSAALLERLPNAGLLHMDDLYPGWDGLTVAVATLYDQVLGPLARGEPAAYRQWDWVHDRYGDWRSVPATDLLLVEGVGSGARPGADLTSALVWLEADPVVRLRRGIHRDGESYRPHWERWAADENTLFAFDGTRQRANLIMNTSGLTDGWA